jgi:NAD(P)-dependent dehydrogenase (short-subunit alcohol dehydrogenase family)
VAHSRPELLGLVKAEVDAAAGPGKCTTMVCDATSDAAVAAAFEKAKELGTVVCLVYNCAPGFPKDASTGETVSFANLPAPHEVDPAYLNSAFDIGVTGCVRFARHFLPYFVEKKGGTFLVSGATMALRGAPKFGALAPVKSALRTYCQAMSQTYHKQNVHIAHVVIDGVVDSPNTRSWAANVDLICPADLAQAYIALHNQPRTVWSHEIQLTPSGDSLGMRL